MFPMMMTAAGTVAPARVFVVGAGVAGLQAIATARKLGAIVEAYDVRPAVKEQVESLGGKFVELELETTSSEDAGGYAKELGEDFYRKQREMMLKVVAGSDVDGGVEVGVDSVEVSGPAGARSSSEKTRNWTRVSAELLGTVYLHVDATVPAGTGIP